MGTVYVTQEDAFIGKTEERLTVKADKKKVLDVPLIKVEGVVALGRTTVSPAVVIELLERNIPLSFMRTTGKYLGRLQPEMTKNIFVRKAQWAAMGETDLAVGAVRGFVRGKLKNYRTALMTARRKFEGMAVDEAIAQLQQAIAALEKTKAIDSLRGYEGAGSAAYFGCFNQLIRVSHFSFKTRNRRPPTDPVNSLLSLGYSLLRHDIQSAVNIVGFDPYLGYLHVERYGRPSLALDLMEEFRPLIVDGMVLGAINLRQLLPEHFETEPLSHAVSLTREGLQIFLRLYEQKKQSEFKHPVLKRKHTYREAFEIQARLLAKYLMGEIDKYPPLIIR
ncbi:MULTISPECIES: type I-D CRISPR-associated endonuclease Cas1d [Spirulina sp. CCY15215]|uniref:type I-D CRISPR-associated endonuclease Cas1d n=1 Tax=Spirulina sp. CCY15215 TaxID=2767591 RepID=UPI0019528C42|nr:type I-D CRISPR-associated endonuclease Cas1d [Spirulina major]